MYDEVYAEWLVKCKKPVYITLLKVLVCILLVLSILAMLIVWFGFIFVHMEPDAAARIQGKL